MFMQAGKDDDEADMTRFPRFTIARVIARLNVGGPSTQAVLMTEAFRNKGYRALLITGDIPAGEGSMEGLARERGVVPRKIRTLSRRVSFGNDVRSFWELIKLFRRERPVVVHTHTAKAGALGRCAAILTRVPVRVHTFHGHVFRGYFSPAKTRICIAIERLLARGTDCIVAISESQRRELVETYKIAPARKVVTIRLGFDLDRFLSVPELARERDELECGKIGKLRVGWIGRMTAIKAPLWFVETAQRILLQLPSALFVMIGDGELRCDCEAAIRRSGLAEKITLLGWKSDLAQEFAAMDLLILTSINEGTPLALLEAMASGRPFIAPDVGGVRDLMNGSSYKEQGWARFDNGILVPRDLDLISAAALYLLRRPALRREMGVAGREFVRRGYSHLRLTNDLEKIYLQLAEKKCANRVRIQGQRSEADTTNVGSNASTKAGKTGKTGREKDRREKRKEVDANGLVTEGQHHHLLPPPYRQNL
jgi:glycosyltransferase involved in cell wall biosynthesis